ncbi:30S ribosomal protein S17 [Candidatus Woesearchaeota archaeon]|nr:30S ribosomal protein S17 [Candidatus Woesearchaeota archaeon]
MTKAKDATVDCQDNHCPVHGHLKLRGRSFLGTVLSAKMQRTAIIKWERKSFVKKYERYETKRTKVKVHNPDCINAKEGDIVKIIESRPLSKTKKFSIIEIVKKK